MKYALVFSGGSTKLPIHLGVWKAVLECNIEYDELWGTSAGAIIAGAIASGYSYESLEAIILNIDFSQFLSLGLWEFGNLGSSGFIDGFELYSFFIDLYKGINFGETIVPLNIIAHSLSRRAYRILNKNNNPNMSIALAARMSSGVPILFKPIEYENEWWVDGGLSKNFAVDLPVSDHVLGSFINSPGEYNNDHVGKLRMLGVLLENFIYSNSLQSIDSIKKRKNLKRFIFCESMYNKSLLDFSVTLEEKQIMIDCGYKNAMEAINGKK